MPADDLPSVSELASYIESLDVGIKNHKDEIADLNRREWDLKRALAKLEAERGVFVHKMAVKLKLVPQTMVPNKAGKLSPVPITTALSPEQIQAIDEKIADAVKEPEVNRSGRE